MGVGNPSERSSVLTFPLRGKVGMGVGNPSERSSVLTFPLRGKVGMGVGNPSERSSVLTFPLRGKVGMGVGYDSHSLFPIHRLTRGPVRIGAHWRRIVYSDILLISTIAHRLNYDVQTDCLQAEESGKPRDFAALPGNGHHLRRLAQDRDDTR